MRPGRRGWLFAAAALMWPLGAAWPQSTRVPTVTRLVKIFFDLEAQLARAAAAGDANTLQRLLADDFEMRSGREPGTPTARADWLSAIAQQRPREAGIEQMAAHDHGSVVDVSFLLRPSAGAPVFVVDTWAKEGDAWRLKVRYAASVAQPSPPLPGESSAASLPKKY